MNKYEEAVRRPVDEQAARTPDSDYIARHRRAMAHPMPGQEMGLVGLIAGLAEYARGYETSQGTKIGNDVVLGKAWAEVLRGTRALLNGESGRLDCGFLDGAICNLYREAGFDDSDL